MTDEEVVTAYSDRRIKHARLTAQKRASLSSPETQPGWLDYDPHLDAALARLGKMDRNLVVARYLQRRSWRKTWDLLGIRKAAQDGEHHKLTMSGRTAHLDFDHQKLWVRINEMGIGESKTSTTMNR
jgi:hypothetical protein